jgi:hypothetical protein
LIAALGCPLYAITAKRSMAKADGDSDISAAAPGDTEGLPPIPEEDLFDGGWEMEDIAGIDLILDTGEERPRIFSTILDISGPEVGLVRPGAGVWPV